FVMYLLNFVRGQMIPYHHIVAMVAGGVLLIQYILGFSLLGAGRSITWFHILVALLAILPVGAAHMLTAQETGMRRRGTIGMMATVITFVLVLVAFSIGEASA